MVRVLSLDDQTWQRKKPGQVFHTMGRFPLQRQGGAAGVQRSFHLGLMFKLTQMYKHSVVRSRSPQTPRRSWVHPGRAWC